MKLAIAFQGQGAQQVGLAKEWIHHPTYRSYFDQASTILGYDLFQICQTEKIHETKYTQPALFTANLAQFSLLPIPKEMISYMFGLSLGEYTSMVASQRISFSEMLPLVQKRSEKMQELAIRYPSKMVVALNFSLEEIEKACNSVRHLGFVGPCNFNTSKQLVIGGTLEALEAVCIRLKENKKGKLLPLPVSGAFHSPLFKEATEVLDEAFQEVFFSDSPIEVLSNQTGTIQSKENRKKCLTKQISSPVQFVTMCNTLNEQKVTHVLEIGEKAVVSPLVKKNQRQIKTDTFLSLEHGKKSLTEWGVALC